MGSASSVVGSVVVTGAAGALGSEVARHLVKRAGYKVALVDIPRADAALRALADELGRENASALTADIADARAWEDLLPRIERDLGVPVSYGALIAGGWRGGAPLHEEKDDDAWRTMLTQNLETAHATLRALLPGMVAREHGSIVLIGSRAAERPWTSANASAYAASKAAVVALAQAVAAEVLARGVRINTILPSTLDTQANRRAMPAADPSKWVSTTSAAGVISFLLSDAARDISGAAIPLYGQS
jgi:NAD(P)-dependent dehydrogenase (short-subunit alcohol dehydrogenase family)